MLPTLMGATLMAAVVVGAPRYEFVPITPDELAWYWPQACDRCHLQARDDADADACCASSASSPPASPWEEDATAHIGRDDVRWGPHRCARGGALPMRERPLLAQRLRDDTDGGAAAPGESRVRQLFAALLGRPVPCA